MQYLTNHTWDVSCFEQAHYCWVMSLFSLPMWINKNPIWTNPFLSISPFLWGKYKPILGLIFRFFREFFSSQKREKREKFAVKNPAITTNFKLRFPLRFLSDWADFWTAYYLHLNLWLETDRVGFGGLQLQFCCREQ